MNSANPANRVICAIDTDDLARAIALAKQLTGQVGAFKLGLEFYTAHGLAGVKAVSDGGMPIFLDLKFSDIPNTVAGAMRAAAGCAPAMLTVHATGGAAMMRAAAAAGMRIADATGGARPKILGVTVLTSFDEDDVAAVGMIGPLRDQVKRLAELAQQCGLDGVVASAHEIATLRQICGPDFTLVVPGIRPGWAGADDQKRIVTPADALRQGADYLVVGRPITRSDDPAAAAARIAEEMIGMAA